jgi:hypothetical protein
MDVHPAWSGPCEMMFPTYKSLQVNIDDFEKRVDVVTVINNLYASAIRIRLQLSNMINLTGSLLHADLVLFSFRKEDLSMR